MLGYIKADQTLSRDDVNALVRAFRTVDVNDPNSVRFKTLPVDPDPDDPNVTLVPPRARTTWSTAAHLRRRHPEARDGAAVAGDGARHRRHRHQRGAVGREPLANQGFHASQGTAAATVPVTEIRYAYGQSEEAKALLDYFPDAKLVPDATAKDAVHLVLGSSFPGEITVPPTTTTVPPARRCPARPSPPRLPPRPRTHPRTRRSLPAVGRSAADPPVHFPAVRILVTGAAGQVGARVVEALAGHHEVLGSGA